MRKEGTFSNYHRKSTNLLTVSGCSIFVAAALEIEPRALGMLSKHCPTELQAGYTRPVTTSNGKGKQHGVQGPARHRGGYAFHRGELCSKCIPEIRPFRDRATIPPPRRGRSGPQMNTPSPHKAREHGRVSTHVTVPSLGGSPRTLSHCPVHSNHGSYRIPPRARVQNGTSI